MSGLAGQGGRDHRRRPRHRPGDRRAVRRRGRRPSSSRHGRLGTWRRRWAGRVSTPTGGSAVVADANGSRRRPPTGARGARHASVAVDVPRQQRRRLGRRQPRSVRRQRRRLRADPRAQPDHRMVDDDRCAARHARSRGCGRIINIGSGAPKTTGASVPYTTAKHGLVGFTKQLRQLRCAVRASTPTCSARMDPTRLCSTSTPWPPPAAPSPARESGGPGLPPRSLQHRILEAEEHGRHGHPARRRRRPRHHRAQVISVDGGYKV